MHLSTFRGVDSKTQQHRRLKRSSAFSCVCFTYNNVLIVLPMEKEEKEEKNKEIKEKENQCF